MRSGSNALRTATIHHLRRGDDAALDAWRSSAYSTPLIFVTSVARSGTNLVTRMLGAHTAIKAFDSLDFIPSRWAPDELERALPQRAISELAATMLAQQTSHLWGGQPSSVERSWARQVVEHMIESERTPAGIYATVMRQLVADAGRAFACDQAPLLIHYARRLLAVFPNAFVIYVVCDPRFSLALRKSVWWGRPLGAERPTLLQALRKRLSYHPITASRHWRRATQEAAYLSGHSRFLLLRLEELVSDPRAGAQRLCQALGLSFESDMIEVPRWANKAEGKFGDYEIAGFAEEAFCNWSRKLRPSETLICEQVTWRMMRRFGYSPTHLGRRPRLSTLPSRLSYPFHIAAAAALNPRAAWRRLRMRGGT